MPPTGGGGEGHPTPSRPHALTPHALTLLLTLTLASCSLPGSSATPTPAPTVTVAPAIATPTAMPTAIATLPPVPSATLPSATVTPIPSVAPTATVARPPSPTAAPTPTPLPPTLSPTRPPIPTATRPPATPTLTKLTGNGCCTQPQWLADGSGVLYYGYGGADGRELGAWVVPRGGGAARSFGPAYGTISASGQLVAYRDGATTTVARPDGTPLGTLPSGVALLFIAPTDDRIAWLEPDPSIPQVSTSLEPPARVRIATISPNGVGPIRTLDPIVRAEVLTWLPNGRRIVLSTRDAQGLNGGISVLDTETGAIRQIATGNFLESIAVAPDGSAIVYTAVLQPNSSNNGIWYVRPDGSGRRKLPLTGGYRWTPDSQELAYIPASSDQPTDELRLYSLSNNTTRPLVTPAQARFLVASNDWDLAPDGRAILFRSATDGAIYVLEFSP